MIAFNTAEGWSRDLSEDIADEIIDRVHDADAALTDGTKRFIDRHVDLERGPATPSVRRANELTRKKVG